MKKTMIIVGAVLAILASHAAVGYYSNMAGRDRERSENALRLATAPKETTWTSYAVTPPRPPKAIAQGKPIVMTATDSIRIIALLTMERDSLESLVWQLAQPFYVQKEYALAIVRMAVNPVTREVEMDLEPKPITVPVPQVETFVPVPESEPWYTHPLMVTAGVLLGAGAVALAGGG